MKAQLADGADLPRLQQAAYDQIDVAFGNTEFDDSEIVTKMKAEMADREEVPAAEADYTPSQVWLSETPKIEYVPTKGATDPILVQRQEFAADRKNMFLKYGCEGTGSAFSCRFLGTFGLAWDDTGMDPTRVDVLGTFRLKRLL